MHRTLALLSAAAGILALGSTALAAPLVTGDLSIYYDFEDYFASDTFGTSIVDQSGNNIVGRINREVSPNEGFRGTTGALFGPRLGGNSGPQDADHFNYIDLDGPNFPDDLKPTTAITVAVWAKLTNTGTDHEIFSPRANPSVFIVHSEFRGDGQYRWLLRDANSQNIMDGRANNAVVYDEWLHYAGTYDQATNQWVIYRNGQQIAQGTGSATSSGVIANNYLNGAFIGSVPDFNRQFTGVMDELYVFKRALSAEEIMTLYNGAPINPAPGDVNRDGAVNDLDLGLIRDNLGVNASTNLDLDRNGSIDLWDFKAWQAAAAGAPAVATPEPSSALLASSGLLSAIAVGLVRRRRSTGHA